MRSWNFVLAGVFIFFALSLLSVAVNVASEAKTAQILVAPDFGQPADQAWDSWRSSIFDLFSFLPLF